jgi:hypothetical protein
MRHGVLASVGVLTLICLAAGDEAREWRPDKDQAVCFPQIKERNDNERPVRRLPERSDKLAEMELCVEHIRIAANHLKTAGMHELAKDLVAKAEAMEREVEQAKTRRVKEQEELRRQLHKRELQLEEIKRGVYQLRNVMSKA